LPGQQDTFGGRKLSQELLFCFFGFFGGSANSNGDVSALFHTDNFNMLF